MAPKSLSRTQWGYLQAVYLPHSSSCSSRESLRTATPLQSVCFRWVCEKRRRGVWDCVCLEAGAKRWGVGAGGVNRRTGLLHCCPHSWSFPSCSACPLMPSHSVWPWVWCQISQTFANSNKVVFFFCELSSITIFLQLLIKHRGKMFLTFMACEELLSLSESRPQRLNLTAQITRARQKQNGTGLQTKKCINKVSDEARWVQ